MRYNHNEPRDCRGRWTCGGLSYAATFYPDHPEVAAGTTTERAVLASSEKTWTDPIAQKKQKWVDDHYDDAKKVADRLGISPEQILGVAALESQWGTSRIARGANNYFGMHAQVAGQSGEIKALGGARIARFRSFSDSAQAFANRYGGMIAGVRDPVAFARILQDKGRFGVGNSGYVKDVANTVNGLKAHSADR